MSVETGTSNTTLVYFEEMYRDRVVLMCWTADPGLPWPLTCEHLIAPLDHYGVPTGEIVCYRCWAVATDPFPPGLADRIRIALAPLWWRYIRWKYRDQSGGMT